jgi:hypothetical protein
MKLFSFFNLDKFFYMLILFFILNFIPRYFLTDVQVVFKLIKSITSRQNNFFIV